MYEKTGDKWNVAESDIKALMIFYNQYNYRLVCEMMDAVLKEFQYTLENDKDLHEICRSQGALFFHKGFKLKMESLIKDAKDEEDGVFGEGDTINPKEMIQNGIA